METAGHGRENYPFCATQEESKLPERELRQKVSQEAANQVGPSFGTLHVSIRVTDLLNCGWKYGQSQNSWRMEVLDMIFIMSNLVYEALKANAVYDKSGDPWQECHVGSCMLLQSKLEQVISVAESISDSV